MEEILLRIYAGQQTLQWKHNIVNKSAPEAINAAPLTSHMDWLEAYGQTLYDTYLRGTFFEEAMSIAESVILRVYDLSSHCWELLHDGDKYLAFENVVILRMPSSNFSSTSMAINRSPLRILVTIISTSSGLTKSQADETVSLFQHLERNSLGMVEATILRNPSRMRWMRAIDDAASEGKGFHIWHYAGEQVDAKTLQLDGSTITCDQISVLLGSQTTLRGVCLDIRGVHVQSDNFRLLTVPFLIVPQITMQPETPALFFKFFYDSIIDEDLAQAVLKARQKLYSYSVGDSQMSAAITVYSRTIDYELICSPQKLGKKLPVMARDQVFISYSRSDEIWCKRLMGYLEPLRQSHIIRAWVDTDIAVGSDWFDEIQKALFQAKVAVFLASPGFFQSRFIQTHEVPYILEQRKLGNCTVVWVAVSAYLYKLTPLNSIQAVHPPSEPLDRMSSTAAEDVLLKIVRLVAEALKEN